VFILDAAMLIPINARHTSNPVRTEPRRGAARTQRRDPKTTVVVIRKPRHESTRIASKTPSHRHANIPRGPKARSF